MEAEAEAGGAKHLDSADEGPWKAFLPSQTDSLNGWLAGNSSEVDQTLDSGPACTGPRAGAEATTWSQRATQGDGTQPDASTCIVSSSLPSIVLESYEEQVRKRRDAKDLDELKAQKSNDGFWQRLVFGGEQAEGTRVVKETRRKEVFEQERCLDGGRVPQLATGGWTRWCKRHGSRSDATSRARPPLTSVTTSSGSIMSMLAVRDSSPCQ